MTHLRTKLLAITLFGALLIVPETRAQSPAGETFEFVRIRWTDNNRRFGYGFSTNAPLWAHDYPYAEQNLYIALQAATSFKISEDHQVLTFADDEIFRYPIIYACEIGYLTLSELEVKNLREYLLRGGFLIVDDFRWPMEWRNWVREIRKVLPDSPLRQIPADHPIFHCFFDLNEDIHIRTPYLRVPPQYWGLFDENGRLLVMINFNNDIGDGWELPNEPGSKSFSTLSYKLGINYLIYSYTH